MSSAMLLVLVSREESVREEMLRIWHTEKREITHPEFLARYVREPSGARIVSRQPAYACSIPLFPLTP